MSNNSIEEKAIKIWQAYGLTCAVVEAPLWGAINGYVKLPEDHPDFGKLYSEIDVECHGGLTYGNYTISHNDIIDVYDSEGWVGFDTLHAWDWWPGMINDNFVPRYKAPHDHEWSQEEVEAETEQLARQLSLRYTKLGLLEKNPE